MKITIGTTVITFEKQNKDHNRLAVTTIAGVLDSFPPVDEPGSVLMERLAGLVEMSHHKRKEYLEKFPEKEPGWEC